MKIWRRLVLVPSLLCDVGVSVVRTGRRVPLEDVGRYHQGTAAKIEEQQRLIDELKSSLGGASAPAQPGGRTSDAR